MLPVGLDGTHANPALGWLWLALAASGLYHGINPGMGWPLAVSAGLMDKSPRALFRALSVSYTHLTLPTIYSV